MVRAREIPKQTIRAGFRTQSQKTGFWVQRRLRAGRTGVLFRKNSGNGGHGQRRTSGVGGAWAPGPSAQASPRPPPRPRPAAHLRTASDRERAEPVFLGPPALGALWDGGGAGCALEAPGLGRRGRGHPAASGVTRRPRRRAAALGVALHPLGPRSLFSLLLLLLLPPRGRRRVRVCPCACNPRRLPRPRRHPPPPRFLRRRLRGPRVCLGARLWHERAYFCGEARDSSAIGGEAGGSPPATGRRLRGPASSGPRRLREQHPDPPAPTPAPP